MTKTTRAKVARRFGDALRHARARAGITQDVLAERSTVSIAGIRRYEGAVRPPGLVEALLLAAQLPELSLDALA